MASAGSLFAAATESNGLLGQRYVQISGGAIDSLETSRLGTAAGARITLPVLAQTDLALAYGYRQPGTVRPFEPFEMDERSHAVRADVTEYLTWRGLKPFATAGVGYRWWKRDLDFGGTHVATFRNDGTEWRAGAGAEIPAGRVTLTPAVTYRAGFDGSARTFTYGLQAHTWVTPRVGMFAGITYDDPQPRYDEVSISTGGGSGTNGTVAVVRSEDSAAAAWSYTVGARLRF